MNGQQIKDSRFKEMGNKQRIFDLNKWATNKRIKI